MTGVKAGRSLWWAAGLVLSLAALVVGYIALRGPDGTAVLPAPRPSAEQSVDGRGAAATTLLDKLSAALRSGDRAAAVALAAPGKNGARAELSDLVANVRELRITDLTLRYVDEQAGRRTTALPAGMASRAWVGDVQVDWRIDGYDQEPSSLEVPVVFLRTRTGAAFVTAREDFDEQAPLWLLERLSVARSSQSLAMVAGRPAEAERFGSYADQAVRDVRKVLPRWRGRLVVEVPGAQDVLDRVVDSGTSYDAIAAVTAPTDGSTDRSAPSHIFVNPRVFDPLGPRGSQIVMSHEAAHVATDGAYSTMPTWLLEGFADYVALAHVNLPVTVTASQILGQVRKDGAPARLPGEAEFDAENAQLGASYEAAWLACRLLASTYGEDKLIAFYQRADRDNGTTAAFRSVLGTNEQQFTARWRSELRRLAG